MVRAILDGKKTQTRRVVKGDDQWFGCFTGDCPHELVSECEPELAKLSPYGGPGDRLWLRETWAKAREGFLYRATQPNAMVQRWKPSIHMPRAASRITLEVVHLRGEYLQFITEQDAKAEGFESREEFRKLFDELNAARGSGYTWQGNPTVLVVEFKVIASAC